MQRALHYSLSALEDLEAEDGFSPVRHTVYHKLCIIGPVGMAQLGLCVRFSNLVSQLRRPLFVKVCEAENQTGCCMMLTIILLESISCAPVHSCLQFSCSFFEGTCCHSDSEAIKFVLSVFSVFNLFLVFFGPDHSAVAHRLWSYARWSDAQCHLPAGGLNCMSWF